MEFEYYYYIAKQPINNETLETSPLPVITKIRKGKFPFQFGLIDKNEGEGPFDSLYDLKKKSFIFSTIKLQKHKQRVLKNKTL